MWNYSAIESNRSLILYNIESILAAFLSLPPLYIGISIRPYWLNPGDDIFGDRQNQTNKESITFAGYFLVLYLFKPFLVERHSGFIPVLGLRMLITEANEYDSIGCSVDKKGPDVTKLLELKDFSIVKGNSLAFSNPVFAILLFYEVLCLYCTLCSGHVGLFEIELLLQFEVCLLLL